MNLGQALAAAVLGTVGMLIAAEIGVRRLTHVARLYDLPPGLVGLLAALIGDGPEISTAVLALASNASAVSLGVILGAGIFNIAASLGFAAFAFGPVRARAYGLAINGGGALAALAASTPLIYRAGSGRPGALPLIVIGLVSVLILGMGARRAGVFLGPGLRRQMAAQEREEAMAEAQVYEGRALQASPLRWHHALTASLAIVCVVFGAYLALHGLLAASRDLHAPSYLVANFVLPIITALPNAYFGAQLARSGRGAAVVSSAFNGNLINLVAGLALPWLAFGPHRVAYLASHVDFPMLALMDVSALALLLPHRRLGRASGILLMALYLAYTVVRLTSSPR